MSALSFKGSRFGYENLSMGEVSIHCKIVYDLRMVQNRHLFRMGIYVWKKNGFFSDGLTLVSVRAKLRSGYVTEGV